MDVLDQWAEFFPQFLPGLWVTIKLTIASLALGYPAGVVLAVLAGSPRWFIQWPAIAVIELGRGMPGLITLYLVYYGLPEFGISFENFLAATLALAFTTSGYSSEIFRAGLLAVPRSQREASRALGLKPWKELRLVVLPQALRIVIPPLIGFSIILYQGTSLTFAISTPELLSRAYNAASISFQFTAALTLAGVMYAVISLAGVALMGGRNSDGSARRIRIRPRIPRKQPTLSH